MVCGETGSGKTTQLPKICLRLGRGADGLIGHTQPRRLAARAVADRLAEELGSRVGEAVGYQVRFDVRRSEQTRILFMTEAVLTGVYGEPERHPDDHLLVWTLSSKEHSDPGPHDEDGNGGSEAEGSDSERPG